MGLSFFLHAQKNRQTRIMASIFFIQIQPLSGWENQEQKQAIISKRFVAERIQFLIFYYSCSIQPLRGWFISLTTNVQIN